MRLNKELVLEQVRVLTMKTVPTQEDPILHIPLRVSLTQEVAESFGCHSLIYAGSVPRLGVKEIDLEGLEVDCEVHFEHDNYSAHVVASEVGKFVAKMDGESPQLHFTVKLKGYAEIVSDLAMKVKIDPVTLTLKPAQANLGLKDGPCAGCNAGTPLLEHDPLHHVSGEGCQNYRVPQADPTTEPAAEEAGAPLAAAAVMGGTHARKRRGSKADPEAEAVAQAQEKPKEEIAAGDPLDFVDEVIN